MIHQGIHRKITRIIASFAIVYILSFGTAPTAHADWGATAAQIWARIDEKLDWHIEGIMNGVFKRAQARIMNARISMSIGGGGGKGPLFITNWQQFLITDPRQKSLSYMNDFFTMSTRGRNSSVNYRPRSTSTSSDWKIIPGPTKKISSNTPSNETSNFNASWLAQEGIIATANADYTFPPEAFDNAPRTTPLSDAQFEYQRKIWTEASQSYAGRMQGNYYKYQTNMAQANLEPSVPAMDLLNYVSNPYDIFTRGNWRGFSPFFSNPSNNPFGYSRLSRDVYQNKLAQEAHIADMQAIAYQGFKAVTGKDGSVKTPGITIGQLVEASQKFNFDNISNAEHLTELLSAGLDAALNMAVDSIVDMGLSQVSSLASKFGLNVGFSTSSYASTDWNSSGDVTGFRSGMDNFNYDAQSAINGNSQTWGDFNFGSTDVGSATNTLGNQNSYSSFDSGNFNFEGLNANFNTPTSTSNNNTNGFTIIPGRM